MYSIIAIFDPNSELEAPYKCSSWHLCDKPYIHPFVFFIIDLDTNGHLFEDYMASSSNMLEECFQGLPVHFSKENY